MLLCYSYSKNGKNHHCSLRYSMCVILIIPQSVAVIRIWVLNCVPFSPEPCNWEHPRLFAAIVIYCERSITSLPVPISHWHYRLFLIWKPHWCSTGLSSSTMYITYDDMSVTSWRFYQIYSYWCLGAKSTEASVATDLIKIKLNPCASSIGGLDEPEMEILDKTALGTDFVEQS